jgi:hypothetical protein
MSDTTEDQEREPRMVFCKGYHHSRPSSPRGTLRGQYQVKSSCPNWANDHTLQHVLIEEAMEDSGGQRDSLGRPKRLWNAVEDVIFVGVSCNLQTPHYNCYPERPPCGKLLEVLERRAERTRDEVLAGARNSNG